MIVKDREGPAARGESTAALQIRRDPLTIRVETTLEAAWQQMHAAMPPGWVLGRPSYHDERRGWILYAYARSERPRMGQRSREWTAVAGTEVGVVCEMARCLREIREGRWPA